jgi:hypothetical protein
MHGPFTPWVVPKLVPRPWTWVPDWLIAIRQQEREKRHRRRVVKDAREGAHADRRCRR